VVISSVVSSFVLSHSLLSPLESPPCPGNSNCKYPHAFGYPVQRTPLALGIPKSHLWYRYGYFLESSNVVQILAAISGENCCVMAQVMVGKDTNRELERPEILV